MIQCDKYIGLHKYESFNDKSGTAITVRPIIKHEHESLSV